MTEKISATDKTTSNSENPPNNPFFFLSLIPKFLLKPFDNNNNDKIEYGKSVKSVDKQEISDTNTKTPDAVKLPRKQVEIPSVKLDSEDVQEDTNPLILWQVYALGGFILLKWAWGKWQERKGKAKNDSTGEDQPPPPAPGPAPAED
ncbi:Undecaprenyl-diphosphatase [Bienertia sinuspersici]